jgi:uncharacterized protein YcgL (UPF0745 family)
MKIKVYKSRHSPTPGVTQFLVIPIESSVSDVPSQVVEELGELIEFKELDVKSGENRVAVDVDKVLKGISEQGYHIARTEIRMTESVLGESDV